jgi:diadenylate cyclase
MERETGLGEIAESGVMIDALVSPEVLETIFTPRSPLHDGAVIIRNERIVAAGALLPLAETTLQSERFGTRHRAALGITEQTDAVVVVVSEENGQISLVERARIVRNLNEAQLVRAINTLLNPAGARRSLFGIGPLVRADERRRRGQATAARRLFGRGSEPVPTSDEERAAAASARANR